MLRNLAKRLSGFLVGRLPRDPNHEALAYRFGYYTGQLIRKLEYELRFDRALAHRERWQESYLEERNPWRLRAMDAGFSFGYTTASLGDDDACCCSSVPVFSTEDM